MSDNKPNWNKWKLIPDAVIRQVAALSLNMSPEEEIIAINDRYITEEQDSFNVRVEEYKTRVQIIEANTGHEEVNALNPVRYDHNKNQHVINIPKFAKWALSVGWEIPPELAALASKEDKVIKPVAEKPLSDKERETLLIIIAALAKEAKIDINKASKAGELIASLTQQTGASVGATTIETHLKKIAQALENRAK